MMLDCLFYECIFISQCVIYKCACSKAHHLVRWICSWCIIISQYLRGKWTLNPRRKGRIFTTYMHSLLSWFSLKPFLQQWFLVLCGIYFLLYWIWIFQFERKETSWKIRFFCSFFNLFWIKMKLQETLRYNPIHNIAFNKSK